MIQVHTLPTSHFLFLSSCPEPWGGSEELWSAAARNLANGGHRVTVCKTAVDLGHPRVAELVRAGIVVDDYCRIGIVLLARAIGYRLLRRHRSAQQAAADSFGAGKPKPFAMLKAAVFNATLAVRIRSINPDFAVISQGENFDGLKLVLACRRIGVPYVLICQKASDFHWPVDAIRELMQDAFREARAVYFVSQHNRTLTERQLGFTLPNAEVVRNPFLTQVEEALPYPEASDGRLRLACVARLFTLEKGQDMLLQVLSQEKWRRRDVDVNFYGYGVHRIALEQAAKMLDLRNVSFEGFTDDVTAIWRTHHALVLPSRCEGLPLVLVEAMLCGRPVIVTNAGGNGEMVDDEVTGFVAHGTDVASIDEAMERAWNRRADWERMGKEAAERVRKRIPADPGHDFTVKLTSIFNDAGKGGR